MKKTLTISIAIIISIAYYSCLKKKYFYINQDTKDYCVFPEGSYWVYQDSVTGILDSVYLVEQRISVSNPGDTNYESESIINIYKYYNNNVLLIDEYYARIHADIDEHYYSIENILLLDTLGSYDWIYYWNRDEEWGGKGLLGLYSLELYNKYLAIIIDEVEYRDIICNLKYYNNRKNKTSEDKCYFYWARHVGLVKAVFHANTDSTVTKNLVRYHINN